MDVFKELRRLYVNVGNDVRHLRETANHPRIGLSRLEADKLCIEPLSDVKLQGEKVKAKIKELQSDTHFGEVVTCCFDVVNDSLSQLDHLERHLQKYSVQPIGNARQQCEVESGLPSKENKLPSAICNPISTAGTAVDMVTEPCQTQAKEWPMTYNTAPTPKLSDFGISESFTQHLDEMTAAILKRSQMNHTIAGQDQAGNGISNSTTDPSMTQPSCHSSPTGTDTTAAYHNLRLDVSAIRGRGQDQGASLSKKPAGELVSKTHLNHEQSNLVQSMHGLALIDESNFCSTLPFPLHDSALNRMGVGLSGCEVKSDHLESSSKAKSTLKVLDLPIPSPPQLSDMAKKALEFHAVARDRASILPQSVKSELDWSPSLSTSLLSEQTVNILNQLRMSKISASSIKLEPYSAEKIGENIPPEHPSMWKITAAKRCLDLGGDHKREAAVSGNILHQDVVSATKFMPGQHTATGVAVADQISNRSSVADMSSVLGQGDGTNNKCKKSVKNSSGSRFGSVDWTCPKILHYSLDEYESLVPTAIKDIVTLECINDCIDKANDVLLNKMLDDSLMTLSVEDLKDAFGSNASLFLKLMAKTGKLSKTGERGVIEYTLI